MKNTLLLKLVVAAVVGLSTPVVLAESAEAKDFPCLDDHPKEWSEPLCREPECMFVSRVQAELKCVIKHVPVEQRQADLDRTMDRAFDYGRLAKDSLGKEWAGRTHEEKKEFQELLKALVKKSYRTSFHRTVGYDVEVYASEKGDGGTKRVKTRAKKDAKVALEIIYTIESTGRGKVIDVTVDDSSLVGSYRNQFTNYIRRQGFAALIVKMKGRLAKGDR